MLLLIIDRKTIVFGIILLDFYTNECSISLIIKKTFWTIHSNDDLNLVPCDLLMIIKQCVWASLNMLPIQFFSQKLT